MDTLVHDVNKKESHQIHGFNYLRTIGLLLVLWQHQMSVLGLDEFNSLWGISFGQVGVAMFLAVSGCLCMSGHKSPGKWLWSRVSRIYPAYWIVTVLGFLAAWLSGYKTFTAFQFLSQLAGTGLFTHPRELINVATWFISLLLALYVAVFFVRMTPFSRSLLVAMSLICIVLGSVAVSTVYTLLLAHAATFLISSAIFQRKSLDKSMLAIASLVLLLAFIVFQKYAFLYGLIALVSLAVSMFANSTPKWVALASKYSYEIYLCQGIFLVGSQKLLGSVPLLSIPTGLVTCFGAAVAIRTFINKCIFDFWKPEISRAGNV
jgi:peptidoglycan/LPS O-acetylase OafA/YrhL